MWRKRIDEPRNPKLRRISTVLPDRWIDEVWPMRERGRTGRHKAWKTSQLVRMHLLVLLKRLGSFNEISRELPYQRDLRRFCRLRHADSAPQPGTLSKFRARFGPADWAKLHGWALSRLVEWCGTPPVGVVVFDATDLPAAVRHTWKKKTTRSC